MLEAGESTTKGLKGRFEKFKPLRTEPFGGEEPQVRRHRTGRPIAGPVEFVFQRQLRYSFAQLHSALEFCSLAWMGLRHMAKQSQAEISLQGHFLAYESARNELIQRLSLRDQALIAYIASAGAYFGLVIAPAQSVSASRSLAFEAALVLVLPILSLVFTYVILQHHVMIGKIGQFTRSVMPDDVMHWDKHYATWSDKSYLSARTISQALLLVLPVGYTAVFGFQTFPKAMENWKSEALVGLVLLTDFVVFAITMRLQFWAYKLRKETDFAIEKSERPSQTDKAVNESTDSK